MNWSIHRVSLAAHRLAEASGFFGETVGLGRPTRVDERTVTFGDGSRGLRLHQPARALGRSDGSLAGPTGARHVAIEIGGIDAVAGRLARAACPCIEAVEGDFQGAAIYTIDPAGNVVAFCETRRQPDAGQGVQPWEAGWGWGIHHVNLQACDVRETVAFYVEIAGMAEGRWIAPARMGDFSIDPAELAILPTGEGNRGLHIIRPDPGFALRNGFAHNPSLGGHPAFFIPSIEAVKARLAAAGTLVSNAGVYAMAGMHQVYVLDPSANVIEINQYC